MVRHDPAILLTAALRRPARFARFLASRPAALAAGAPFSAVVDSVVSEPALRAFVDVLCMGTSGAPAAALPAEYVVRAFAEMYQPGA